MSASSLLDSIVTLPEKGFGGGQWKTRLNPDSLSLEGLMNLSAILSCQRINEWMNDHFRCVWCDLPFASNLWLLGKVSAFHSKTVSVTARSVLSITILFVHFAVPFWQTGPRNLQWANWQCFPFLLRAFNSAHNHTGCCRGQITRMKWTLLSSASKCFQMVTKTLWNQHRNRPDYILLWF